MIVTSFFPGRIRLRAEVFKDPVIVEECLKILNSSDAITKVSNNFTTGSVLLEYNPKKIPVEKLEPLVPFFKELEKLAHNYSRKNRELILEKLKELSVMLPLSDHSIAVS